MDLQIKGIRGRNAGDGLILKAWSGKPKTKPIQPKLRILYISEIRLETNTFLVYAVIAYLLPGGRVIGIE